MVLYYASCLGNRRHILDIAVTGPRGGQLSPGLTAYTVLAVKSFAKQLGISRLKSSILVRVHSGLTVDGGESEGFAKRCQLDISLLMWHCLVIGYAHLHMKWFMSNNLQKENLIQLLLNGRVISIATILNTGINPGKKRLDVCKTNWF